MWDSAGVRDNRTCGIQDEPQLLVFQSGDDLAVVEAELRKVDG